MDYGKKTTKAPGKARDAEKKKPAGKRPMEGNTKPYHSGGKGSKPMGYKKGGMVTACEAGASYKG